MPPRGSRNAASKPTTPRRTTARPRPSTTGILHETDLTRPGPLSIDEDSARREADQETLREWRSESNLIDGAYGIPQRQAETNFAVAFGLVETRLFTDAVGATEQVLRLIKARNWTAAQTTATSLNTILGVLGIMNETKDQCKTPTGIGTAIMEFEE